jgi:hypothetical protein
VSLACPAFKQCAVSVLMMPTQCKTIHNVAIRQTACSLSSISEDLREHDMNTAGNELGTAYLAA